MQHVFDTSYHDRVMHCLAYSYMVVKIFCPICLLPYLCVFLQLVHDFIIWVRTLYLVLLIYLRATPATLPKILNSVIFYSNYSLFNTNFNE